MPWCQITKCRRGSKPAKNRHRGWTDLPVSDATGRPWLGLEHINKTPKRSRVNYLEKAIKIYNWARRNPLRHTQEVERTYGCQAGVTRRLAVKCCTLFETSTDWLTVQPIRLVHLDWSSSTAFDIKNLNHSTIRLLVYAMFSAAIANNLQLVSFK